MMLPVMVAHLYHPLFMIRHNDGPTLDELQRTIAAIRLKRRDLRRNRRKVKFGLFLMALSRGLAFIGLARLSIWLAVLGARRFKQE